MRGVRFDTWGFGGCAANGIFLKIEQAKQFMKKLKNLYSQVCGTKNLYRAAHATLLQGRRFTSEGARFMLQLERNIHRIQGSLRSFRYQHGKYKEFTIYDPKERVILAAPLEDRIVHHALHDVVSLGCHGPHRDSLESRWRR